jgi:hypothetical protein
MESADKRTANRLKHCKRDRIQVRDTPISFLFSKPEFYIRDCYSHYYQLIMTHSNSGRLRFITVTGSPGIGNFMQRYGNIVLASFTHQQELMKCRVIESNAEFDKIPSIEGTMYLFDGTLRMKPSSLFQRMV